ncbi:STAS domain-containing protein [Streptomyces sp. 3MP-14]|uniref:STAS domain-containing protein n=1 Tax=Streptomyces mimosae TaxID=2586635 RepID=A0A5N6AJM7_9ACTN|nr:MULTISPECIES: STAS domain-containing protein [Streptomyces]KAB8168874.1 STAS domain-containing protein [Streptomyces mimosae]KAB8177847.1 STAS domain-containing protein [Streptomyces sp. 3MP-14]
MSAIESAGRERVVRALRDHEAEIAENWVRLQIDQGVLVAGIGEHELRGEAEQLVSALLAGLATDELPAAKLATEHAELRETLADLSLRRARGGATPTATSLAVLAFKDVVLEILQRSTRNATELFEAAVLLNRVLDAAGVLAFDQYVATREEIISRQSRQLMELSTPVVRLWRRVLAVPLIGTLDTSRTQVVMESLLQAIRDDEAQVAIIDITGVAAVDTSVAHHLMQTVAAVRLMGADCVISGIRPATAQTIAQLGIDLSTILTRATLADALAAALRITGDAPAPAAALGAAS